MSDKNNENAVVGDATAVNPIVNNSNTNDSITTDSVMGSNDESMAIDNKENNNENRTRNRKQSGMPVRLRKEPAQNGPVLVGNRP